MKTSAAPPTRNGPPTTADADGPFKWLLAWRERRFATACCRDLLRLHKTVARSHPHLDGINLYREIVASHIGADHSIAEALLVDAAQSFAIWPVDRELKFRDVVHYLAVSGFIASHGDRQWVYVDMKRIVDASIPHHL